MIDRARHGRLVHDLMFQLIASPRGRRRLLALAVVALVIGRLGGSWLLGANLTAVAAVVEYAFGELELHRVEAGTRLDNVRSQRVLERDRFTRIGVARKHLLVGGAWRDMILFERLSDD